MCSTVKVLFVCTGNACRSPLAEALLKKYRPEIPVDSAGIHPYYRIVDLTIRYADEEKVTDYLKDFPEGLESKNLNDYALVVAMEPQHKNAIIRRFPQCADKVVVWNIDDPYHLPYVRAKKVFEKMKNMVEHLAQSL